MTTAVLAINKVQKNIQAKIDAVELPLVNWRKVCLLGIFATLILAIFYVWQINALTNGFYLTAEYEAQVLRLSDQNKSLQISFAESNFLAQVAERMQVLNFHKSVAVKYMQMPETFLAKAN